MSIRSQGQYVVKRLRPRYRTTADARQIILSYAGPFDALKAQEPAIDSTVNGFPTDHKVREVSIEEIGANAGRMSVTLEKPQPGNTGSTDDNQLSEPIFELDWGEIRSPIEEHPRCPRLKDDRLVYEFPDRAYDSTTNAGWGVAASAPDGKTGRQRTWDDWAAMDSGDVTGGTWSIDVYKAIKQNGINDWAAPFPIARSTIYAKYRIPPTGAVNTISSPPSQCGAPGGWTYVKSASRSSKQGRLYALIEEWRGYPGTGWDAIFG